MSDNVAITQGAGTTIATDDVGGAQYQRIKVGLGADGSATDAVGGAGAVSAAVQRVTLASDDPAVTALQIMDDWDESDRLKVNPIVGQAGVAAGAGAVGVTVPRVTLASDDPAVTALQIMDDWDETDRCKVNIIAGQVGVAGGSGVVSALTQRVVLATDVALPAGTNAIGKLSANSGVDIGDVDVTSVPADPFGLNADAASASGSISAKLRAIATALGITAFDLGQGSGGTRTLRVSAEAVAHDGIDSGNPVKMGGRARSSEIAAVASDDRVDFIADLTGKQIVLPYANPENYVSGAITSAMTGTTSTSLVAAPGAGLRNYINTIIVSNAHATVGTDVIIQDGSGGTTLLTIPAAAVYGGAVITLTTPLRQPTANTALFCANVTTGASTKVSAVGYKGA